MTSPGAVPSLTWLHVAANIDKAMVVGSLGRHVAEWFPEGKALGEGRFERPPFATAPSVDTTARTAARRYRTSRARNVLRAAHERWPIAEMRREVEFRQAMGVNATYRGPSAEIIGQDRRDVFSDVDE